MFEKSPLFFYSKGPLMLRVPAPKLKFKKTKWTLEREFYAGFSGIRFVSTNISKLGFIIFGDFVIIWDKTNILNQFFTFLNGVISVTYFF